MSNPRIFGTKTSCIPNRDADMRRRNNAYKRGRAFAESDWERFIGKQERKLKREKEGAG